MALSLFQAQDNYYDIVIADIRMPEMGISEFIKKLHGQRMTVPVILIAKDLTTDSAKEALGNGVCYVFSKPPSHSDIARVWQHIARVTGELPAFLMVTNYIDLEKDGNPNRDNGSGGGAKNQIGKNLKMKSVVTDKGHIKRKKNQISETSNSANDTEEKDGHNSKKTRITWTPYLHEKFLHSIKILGEHDAQPKRILRLMNEPGLAYRQVSSHLQNYRKQLKRQSLNLQKPANLIMPTVFPQVSLTNYTHGQTSVTASSNCMAASNFMLYSFDGVKQAQDAFNYSGGNSVNAIINHYGVQVPEGNGGVKEPAAASGHLSNGWEALNQEPENASIGHLAHGFQVPNQESTGASSEVLPFNVHLNNGLQAPMQGPAGASGHFSFGWDGLQAPMQGPAGASGHFSFGWEATNQEPAGGFGTVLYGFRNADNMGNMNDDNGGEGTSGANQQFDGMPSYDDIQFMQEFEALFMV